MDCEFDSPAQTTILADAYRPIVINFGPKTTLWRLIEEKTPDHLYFSLQVTTTLEPRRLLQSKNGKVHFCWGLINNEFEQKKISFRAARGRQYWGAPRTKTENQKTSKNIICPQLKNSKIIFFIWIERSFPTYKRFARPFFDFRESQQKRYLGQQCSPINWTTKNSER